MGRVALLELGSLGAWELGNVGGCSLLQISKTWRWIRVYGLLHSSGGDIAHGLFVDDRRHQIRMLDVNVDSR